MRDQSLARTPNMRGRQKMIRFSYSRRKYLRRSVKSVVDLARGLFMRPNETQMIRADLEYPKMILFPP